MESPRGAPAPTGFGPFSSLPAPLRLLFPYAVSLASLAIPAAIAAALLEHPELTR